MGYFPLISLLFAWFRRLQIEENLRFSPVIPIHYKSIIKNWSYADRVIALVMVISLISSGIVLTYVITYSVDEERFTEFYALDQNHTVSNLPGNITVNETATVIIGTICHEYETTEYTVRVNLLNMDNWNMNQTIHEYSITLNHEEMNEIIFDFDIDEIGNYKLEMELFIGTDSESSLKTHIQLIVDGS